MELVDFLYFKRILVLYLNFVFGIRIIEISIF